MRTSLLKWWKDRLGLELLSDLMGSLPRVEQALRELQAGKKAGKTLQNYAGSLVSFCNWCAARGYLVENPLKGLAKFDTTPKTTRRAVTPEDIREGPARVVAVVDVAAALGRSGGGEDAR